MAKAPDLDFQVRWLPYQLSPGMSETPTSKEEVYMRKFNCSRERVQQMALGMQQQFASVGLPFATGPGRLVSNTFQAHRVLTAAHQNGGAEAQDKAAEVLFRGYYGDGRAPSEPALLEEALVAAGLEPKSFLADRSIAEAETTQELQQGREIVRNGVPHFVFQGESGKNVEFSGAQPLEHFLRAFAAVSGR